LVLRDPDLGPVFYLNETLDPDPAMPSQY
jgi:hypothetical protein